MNSVKSVKSFRFTVLSCFFFGGVSLVSGVMVADLAGIILSVVAIELTERLSSGKSDATNWLVLLMGIAAAYCIFRLATVVLHFRPEGAGAWWAITLGGAWGLWALLNFFLLLRLERRLRRASAQGPS